MVHIRGFPVDLYMHRSLLAMSPQISSRLSARFLISVILSDVVRSEKIPYTKSRALFNGFTIATTLNSEGRCEVLLVGRRSETRQCRRVPVGGFGGFGGIVLAMTLLVALFASNIGFPRALHAQGTIFGLGLANTGLVWGEKRAFGKGKIAASQSSKSPRREREREREGEGEGERGRERAVER